MSSCDGVAGAEPRAGPSARALVGGRQSSGGRGLGAWPSDDVANALGRKIFRPQKRSTRGPSSRRSPCRPLQRSGRRCTGTAWRCLSPAQGQPDSYVKLAESLAPGQPRSAEPLWKPTRGA